MIDAFTPAADFSALATNEAVQVDKVLHQVFVKVDEDGTEAAAATAVIGKATAAPLEPVVVEINRPFFYFIRDIPTNTLLFVGREVDPS